MAQSANARSVKVNNKIKVPVSDKVLLTFNNVFLWALMLAILIPLIYVLAASFSSASAVVAGKVYLWPVDFTTIGYESVLSNNQLGAGFMNSFFYMIFGTLASLTATILAAYPLSRKDMFGRGPLMIFFTFTMMFSGGLIPTYLIVRDVGLVNSRLALIIPNALSVYYMIVARTYFQTTIPDELAEAAELDGCSDIGFLFRIALPLSGPLIATLSLFFAVSQWNSYFDALIYLSSAEKYPLQIVLRNILIMNQIDANMMVSVEAMERAQGLRELLKYSLIVVASVPVLAIYPFVQKYFIKGIMIGAIKG